MSGVMPQLGATSYATTTAAMEAEASDTLPVPVVPSSINDNGVNSMPTAPYPPMMSSRYPSTQLSSLRSSSLSSSSAFVAGAPGRNTSTTVKGSSFSLLPAAAEEDGATKFQKSAPQHAPRLQFCHWDVLATINCVENRKKLPVEPHHSQTAAATSGNQSASSSAASSSVTAVAAATRKVGPVLLELRQILFDSLQNDAKNDKTVTGLPSLFSTRTICQSRGNPALGISVASTCLDVARQPPTTTTIPTEANISAVSASSQLLFPCVTGLTTGAVCIHTFSQQQSHNAATAANDIIVYDWKPSIEYYHTTRSHRPATAVAWRPTQRHVAVGLTSASSSSSTGAADGSGGASSVAAGDHYRHSSARATGRGGGGLGTNTSGRRVGSGTGIIGAAVGSADADGGASHRGDFCCYVWDVEHQQQQQQQSGTSIASRRTKTSPLFRLSHQTGVASLAWMGAQTLAVGCQMRNLQIYDMRLSATSGGTNVNSPPITVQAHNFSVCGIQADPSRPWQFATFSRAANEPVKLWDVRNMEKPVSEIKVAMSLTTGNNNNSSSSIGLNDNNGINNSLAAVVSSIQWSTLEPGVLSIALGESISEYDTSSSRPVHVNTVYTKSSILDFSLYPFAESFVDNISQDNNNSNNNSSNKRAVADLFRNRMAIVETDRTITDIARRYTAPLAVSQRDGRIVHGLGRTLWMHGPADGGPTGMQHPQVLPGEDISATMMRRARCTEEFRYGMDAAANVRLLARHEEILGSSVDDSSRDAALVRLWTWIRRIEGLCNEEDITGGRWSAKTLVDTGAWNLLQLDGAREYEMQTYSNELSCHVYESPDRRNALAACGWAGKYDLASVLRECEVSGEYERASALAVWHGDIGAAVDALQSGAEFIREKLASGTDGNDPRISTRYAETLELASMSIAGFRGNNLDSPQSAVWRRVCSGVLNRPDFSGTSVSSIRTSPIRCALKFLLSVGLGDKHQELLADSTLALGDRVGFACLFLDRSELKKFLEKCIQECKDSGNVEGLTITGVDKDGIQILQSFVERYSDVQTVTLVTSRVILPADWSDERRICAEWLDSYRSLLNTWQMWQSRAMFDVDRAELLRKVKARQVGAPASSAGKLIGGGANRRLMSGRRLGPRGLDPDIHAAVPSQLDARCNYCNAPLGLRNQSSAASQWLSKVKPVLSCCPQCRKPLPRCSICMLSLGVLNPYMELTKDRSRPGRGTPSDDPSLFGNISFAEWFAWCVRCKHGGHLVHLVGWFSKHAVCPVSGCDCQCQFDGMPKLTRPLLSECSQVPENVDGVDPKPDTV